MLRWVAAASVMCMAGCAPQPTAAPSEPQGALAPLSDAQWLWVSSECLDGSPELEKIGFMRTLSTEVHGDTLRFVYDTTLAVPWCASTEVWTLTPAPAGEWRFVPDAVVAQPAGTRCGPEVAFERGVLRLSGDTFEEVRFRSSFCRGFDARFVYERVPPEALDAAALVRRYVAHWNRRDADAVARLFAEDGVLVEPFTRSEAGTPTSHRGRDAIRAWLARAFATTPWLALELTDLEQVASGVGADTGAPAASGGRLVASFRYMDARLAEPLRGRNLMVLVGHEIYAAELQLLSDPIPR